MLLENGLEDSQKLKLIDAIDSDVKGSKTIVKDYYDGVISRWGYSEWKIPTNNMH